MKTLEQKILEFENWSQPWTFHDFIIADNTLSSVDLQLFKEIWKKAGDFQFWNNADLQLCAEKSRTFIADNYELGDQSIKNIVLALSYQWK